MVQPDLDVFVIILFRGSLLASQLIQLNVDSLVGDHLQVVSPGNEEGGDAGCDEEGCGPRKVGKLQELTFSSSPAMRTSDNQGSLKSTWKAERQVFMLRKNV